METIIQHMSSRRRLNHSLTDAFAGAVRDDDGSSVLFESGAGAQHFRRLPVERIRPRGNGPRRSMDEESLQELAASLRVHGVLQPIRVRPCASGLYEIVAGERRWLAAQMAGLHQIPAIVVAADEQQAYVESLIENVQREDLNAVDRAHALKQLRVNLGLQSWEDVGRVIGLTRQHVHNLLRITELPDAMQDDVRAGDLSEKHCRALLRLREDADAQHALWQRIHDDHLSGDDAVAEARRTWKARSGAVDADAASVSPAPPAPPRTRIGAVADALLEALGAATPDELDAARMQLLALHHHLGALLTRPAVAPAALTPLQPGGGAEHAEWRPMLVPVAGH